MDAGVRLEEETCMKDVQSLQAEHRQLKQVFRSFCKDYAHAVVYALPTAPDLMETLIARHEELAALELMIASFDPQAGLFADYVEEGPPA